MTSAFVITNGGGGLPDVAGDLESVGIEVAGTATLNAMIPEVIRSEPDLVVCLEAHPDDALFSSMASLATIAARPVVVFTTDPDAEKIGKAIASGIHVYAVAGYDRARLRSFVHVAQARFRHDQSLRRELTDVQHRFSERKLVDRAKGVLMRVRNISEDDAYKALRTAAMRNKQRIGQIAQQVIDAARYGEAVNRAGQLRMLSQRLVKLYALMCAEVTPERTSDLCRESIEHIEANFAILGRILSKPTFGDVLDASTAPWTKLKTSLAGAPTVSRLAEVDRLAERLLDQSDALTRTLQVAGFAAALHVIDVSGRQRMLTQRIAKFAIISGLTATKPADQKSIAAAEKAFDEALAYLRTIPLTSPEIKAQLDAAAETWAAFREALPQSETAAGRENIADTSEALLAQFNLLTDLYERGIQALLEEPVVQSGRAATGTR